jgi:hypothetical protein
MHCIMFKKKCLQQTKLIISAISALILLFSSEKSIEARDKNLALKDAAQLSGGWVGIIKVIPKDLGAVRKFNIQLKLSNSRVNSSASIPVYDYDVLVNIAPAGKPLVRSNFSELTLRSYTDQVGYSYEYIPFFGEFNFVRKGFKNIEFLEGCERGIRIRSIDLGAVRGPWKGEVECRGKGIGDPPKQGEVIIQKGTFEESISSASTNLVSQLEKSIFA